MFDSPAPEAIPALQQTAGFAAALGTFGTVPLHLPRRDGLPGLWLWRRRRIGVPMAMIPRADLGADVAASLHARLAAEGLARHLLILSPDRPAPHLARLGAVPLMTPAFLAELDLAADPDRRLARLHQKWRNRLRHGQKQRLTVRRSPLPPDPSHWLLKAEAAQRERRGYRGWPPAIAAGFALANTGQARLFEAREGAEIVAAVLILCHAPGATYQIGYTTARGRALSAHNLLLWEAAEWLAQKRFAHLDLGLVDHRHAPGLARFKLGTGATLRPLGGTWGWFPPLGRALAPLARLDTRAMAPRAALDSCARA